MSQYISCPWCDDEKTLDSHKELTEGIMFCGRCKKHFEWIKHIEVNYTMRPIEYCDRKDRPWKLF